jgi:hypothetical protein
MFKESPNPIYQLIKLSDDFNENVCEVLFESSGSRLVEVASTKKHLFYLASDTAFPSGNVG